MSLVKLNAEQEASEVQEKYNAVEFYRAISHGQKEDLELIINMLANHRGCFSEEVSKKMYVKLTSRITIREFSELYNTQNLRITANAPNINRSHQRNFYAKYGNLTHLYNTHSKDTDAFIDKLFIYCNCIQKIWQDPYRNAFSKAWKKIVDIIDSIELDF